MITAGQSTCYRCDDRLDDAHQIHLTSTHEGDDTDHYQDVDRRVCLDFLAAIWMLELDREVEDTRSERGGPFDRVIESISWTLPSHIPWRSAIRNCAWPETASVGATQLDLF